MCHHFPKLRLCENDWKVELLATENYPSWYNNHHCNSKIKREDGSSTQLDNKKKMSLNQNVDNVKQAAKKPKTATALKDCWHLKQHRDWGNRWGIGVINLND